MTAYAHLFLIGIVMVMALTESRGYLLDGTYSHDCLSPATCQGCADYWGGVYTTFAYTILKCSSVGLTVFPTIHGNRSIAGSGLSIDFSGNSITSVPANAFQNVHLNHGQEVFIDLNSNLLSSVDTSAFVSISSLLTRLDLSNNQLSSIPSAIGSLNNLLTLKLEGNPLRSVDSSVMRGIGSSLTHLDIGFGQLSSLPSALGYLTSLTNLAIYDLNVALTDPNIFQGFASTLGSLHLLYTVEDHGSRFHTIPDAVTKLTRLYDLRIRGEVYCNCDLAYLKHWKQRSAFKDIGGTRLVCHGSLNHVDDYISYHVDTEC